jgi:DNA-binding GntR family transcriptional regulator
VYVIDATAGKAGPKRPAAAVRAYQAIKESILDRTHAGGTLLTEGELAELVGVSRTPIREALLRLEADGLVRLYPKKGALVLPVSAAEIADLLETRELVEVHTALKAVHAPGLVPELRRELAVMRASRATGDAAAFMVADRAFHRAVVAAAGNAVLTGLYDSLRDRQLRMGEEYMRSRPERMDRALAEHEEILEALAAGDTERVRHSVEHHTATLRATLTAAR